MLPRITFNEHKTFMTRKLLAIEEAHLPQMLHFALQH